MSESKASGGWRIVGLWAIALVSMVAVILAVAGTGDPGLHLVIRSTAQTSFGLFLAAFCASSLYRVWRRPWSRWLIVHRRYVGVSFAVSHFIHLGAIVALAMSSTEFRDSVNAVTVVGGGMAYVFVAAMAVTSSDAAVRLLGHRAWKILHTVGGYYIWIIFFQSYIGRAVHVPSYIPAALLCIGAVGLRLAVRFGWRHPSPSTSSAPQSVGAGAD